MTEFKLQGHTTFQGLPIAIENKKGSYRHWKDPLAGNKGKTLMHHDYGYVEDTLGSDGEDVDVYLGPNKESTKVFVILQMAPPKFTATDENKVMLGFDSAEEAKAAYIKQYDNPKFFGSMKELSIDSFKEKLQSQKGKLIKYLNTVTIKGASMSNKPLVINCNDEDMVKKFKSEQQRKYMYAAAERGEIDPKVVKEFSDKTPKGAKLPKKLEKAMDDTEEVIKSITAMAVQMGPSVVTRTPLPEEGTPYSQRPAPVDVLSMVIRDNPAPRPGGFQFVPVVDPCGDCGTMSKSIDGSCIRCSQLKGLR